MLGNLVTSTVHIYLKYWWVWKESERRLLMPVFIKLRARWHLKPWPSWIGQKSSSADEENPRELKTKALLPVNQCKMCHLSLHVSLVTHASTHATGHGCWRAAGLGSGCATPVIFVGEVDCSVLCSLQTLLQKKHETWEQRSGLTLFWEGLCPPGTGVAAGPGWRSEQWASEHQNAALPLWVLCQLFRLFILRCFELRRNVTAMHSGTAVFYG